MNLYKLVWMFTKDGEMDEDNLRYKQAGTKVPSSVLPSVSECWKKHKWLYIEYASAYFYKEMIIQYEKHKMQMEWPTEEAWAVKQEDMGTTVIDWIQKGEQR